MTDSQHESPAGDSNPSAADKEQDVLRPHSFDGISEYDNKVPQWLQGILILSVLFAVAYLAYFLPGPGKLGADALEAEKLALLAAQDVDVDAIDLKDEEALRPLSHIPDRIARGKELYLGNGQCVMCHGPDGLGLVGPNLRDDGWKYGSNMTDIILSLQQGRPGGMPSAGHLLSKDDMVSMAAFIADWGRTAKANGQGKTDPADVDQPITY